MHGIRFCAHTSPLSDISLSDRIHGGLCWHSYISSNLLLEGRFCVGPDIPVARRINTHLRRLPDQHHVSVRGKLQEHPVHGSLLPNDPGGVHKISDYELKVEGGQLGVLMAGDEVDLAQLHIFSNEMPLGLEGHVHTSAAGTRSLGFSAMTASVVGARLRYGLYISFLS